LGGTDLNKNDLVSTVANSSGLARREAARAVESVLTAIIDALKDGEEVRLVGFGTFTVTNRAASQGRNPRTGETIAISAFRQPKFKAGKALKDALN
jgi:DNA-binding protein HU-beta